MTRRASWAWAITTFLMVALLGTALIKAGAERRMAEQRLEAARLGANALEALEQGLARAYAGLDTLAAEIRARHGVGDFGAMAASAAEQGSAVRNWFFIPRGAAAYVYSHQAAKPGIDLPTGNDWHARGEDRGDAMRSSVVSFCPKRAWAGDAALWLRRPVVFTRSDRGLEFSGWIAASLEVQKIVLPAVLRYHQGPRFHAVLWCSDAASGLRRIVDRSGDAPAGGGVDVFVPNTGRRWGLSLSPTLGWQPTPGLIQHGLLVFILAVIAALVAFEVCQRMTQLTREVACADEKLNSNRRLLIEERQHREELEKQFSHSGFQDALTGLPNRRFFIKQLGTHLYQTRMRQRNFTVVLVVELDRFKTINDSLGHAAGDDLLIQAAQRFASCMKPAELVVARLRSSEFAMLLGGIADQGAALETAKSLQRTLADPFHIRGQSVFTGATIGVAQSDTGFEQAEELLRSADVALSRARSEGQGRIVLVDAAALDQASSLQQLESDLHRAIERSEFMLQFQPVVDLESGGLVGMEALARWRHPLEGLIMPGRFIALAESTGLIVPITRQLLRAACRQARAWREQLPADVSFYMSVNMSTPDLRQTDVCDFVAGAIAEAGLPPGLLRLEVTEGIMIEDLRATRELLARFRQLGIPLLLDDFGTGYSSLSYLSRLPFDYLKIDRAFVNRLGADEQDPGIVRAIVQMARSLGMKTIAEGVETPHHWAQLKALGCDFGQGYYFSKPVDASAMEDMLVSRRKWPVYAADPRPKEKAATAS